MQEISEKLQVFLGEPRVALSGLTKSEYESRSVAQKHLITIMEQIAYRLKTKSQRETALRLGLNQASVQSWFKGEINNPNGIHPEYLEKVARARGISRPELRVLLDGDDPYSLFYFSSDSVRESAEEWLAATRWLPLDISIEGLEIILERLKTQALRNESKPLEKEVEVEVERTHLHEGNQKIATALREKQTQLQMDDDTFASFCALYGMSQEALGTISTSIDPIPDELITGPLPKILQILPEELFEMRDGWIEEGEEEEVKKVDPVDSIPSVARKPRRDNSKKKKPIVR